MSRDIITELLNKVQAMADAGIVTYSQVAKESKIKPRTLYNWFGTTRRDKPNGLGAVMLMAWAAKKTLAVSALPNKDRCAYRAAYNRICERFPVNGKS